MKWSLIAAEGRQAGKIIPISVAQFVIGRHSQCQLRAASSTVSKQHCALLERNGQAWVRDFDSSNGTYVNGVRVEGEARLQNGDCLKVGPLVFLVWIEQAEPDREDSFLSDLDASGTPADSSMIAAALLESLDSKPVPDLLSLAEESSEGSTVLKPAAAAESAPPPTASKPAKRRASSRSARPPLPAAAQALLDAYLQRSKQ